MANPKTRFVDVWTWIIRHTKDMAETVKLYDEKEAGNECCASFGR